MTKACKMRSSQNRKKMNKKYYVGFDFTIISTSYHKVRHISNILKNKIRIFSIKKKVNLGPLSENWSIQ